MMSHIGHARSIVEEIIDRNERIQEFWGRSHGWAPPDAAKLLEESRLDWQVSLSHCLRLWLSPANGEDGEGRLILAWVNLGSLVEGTMKFFLSVFLDDYMRDPATRPRRGTVQVIPPETMDLENLRQFFQKNIWRSDSFDWNAWVLHIQQRRNAIHAFEDREIGTFDEYLLDVMRYRDFLVGVDETTPYPYGRLWPTVEDSPR